MAITSDAHTLHFYSKVKKMIIRLGVFVLRDNTSNQKGDGLGISSYEHSLQFYIKVQSDH